MNLLEGASLTPHGFCLAWQPGLIWLHAVSDLLIATAYFSIPAALLVFLRRRHDLAFKPVFALFAAFILACGTTHVMGALTLWLPAYWLDGGIKAVTALLSLATAIMLWPLVPKALALPSPDALREVNAALAREVAASGEAAERLAASEMRQKRQYARTPAALQALDAQGRVVDVTDRWLDMLGYERADVIGRPIWDFYTPQSAQDSADHLAALSAGSLLQTANRRMRCRDGKLRDIELVLDVEHDAAGRLQRVLAALTDVTAMRETRAKLQAAEERLHHAQKMEAVGQLTGGIAHDFNNLLTTIMGSLELLRQGCDLDARGLKLTSNALEGSRRAAKLTAQLLSFSRRARLSPEALMPGEIVAGVHDLLARTLGDRIELVVREQEAPDAQWPVLADRSQMEAMLLNLVINARDAIEGSGRVTVLTGNCRLSADQVAQWEHGEDRPAPGDYVFLTVADTGCGMSETVRAHAFEPFFTTKQPGSGSGLGLSQTYGFVTQSGGALRIASAPGQGTRVEMLLPRGDPGMRTGAVPAPLPEAASPVPHGRGEHVLVAEDDALLRHTIAASLAERGFRVSQAADGEQAIQVLRGGGVDLLFADVRMPGVLSGVDLAWAVRARWPGMPVVLATGYADAPELSDWTARGEVLAKPYTVDELVRLLLAANQRKQSFSEEKDQKTFVH